MIVSERILMHSRAEWVKYMNQQWQSLHVRACVTSDIYSICDPASQNQHSPVLCYG